MKIKVNTSHIKHGEGGNANSCALALAVREGVEKAIRQEAKKCKVVGLANDLQTSLPDDSIEVDGSFIVVKDKSMRASKKLREFVINFDGLKTAEKDDDHDTIKRLRKLVKPFEFELRL